MSRAPLGGNWENLLMEDAQWNRVGAGSGDRWEDRSGYRSLKGKEQFKRDTKQHYLLDENPCDMNGQLTPQGEQSMGYGYGFMNLWKPEQFPEDSLPAVACTCRICGLKFAATSWQDNCGHH